MSNKKTSLRVFGSRAPSSGLKAAAARLLFLALFTALCSFAAAAPLNSPSWGFSLDLPEGYEYSGGDRKDRFSFTNGEGAVFDLNVYHAQQSGNARDGSTRNGGGSAPYANVEALANDVQRRLNNKGSIEAFEYRQKKAVLLELSFSLQGSGPISGWALCIELGTSRIDASSSGTADSPASRPLLLAMAYGPAAKEEFSALHFSALDSLIPEEGDRYVPGPITEFTYPRKTLIQSPVFGLDLHANLYAEDAEASQALIDREFSVLRRYTNAPNWQEAWQRFYRMIYRDSFDRIADIAFQVERKLNVPTRESRDFADQVLKWVQSFNYERELFGSDFINLISAALEGRGDCDNRAMLWAIVLKQAGIPSAMMVSRHYAHAMGLADLPGAGAHFEVEGRRLLVAETTANVSVGLIGETVSDIEYWLGILFE